MNKDYRLPQLRSIEKVVSRIPRGHLIFFAQVNSSLSENPRVVAQTPTREIRKLYSKEIMNKFDCDPQWASSHYLTLKQTYFSRKKGSYSSN